VLFAVRNNIVHVVQVPGESRIPWRKASAMGSTPRPVRTRIFPWS